MAKSRTSYFDQNIQRSGEDFLDQKGVDEIQRDARRRIFRDMAFGNINYEKYGCYFTDQRFLEQLIVVSYDEMENHNMIYTALRKMDLENPGNQRIIALSAKEGRLTQAFQIINMYLNTVKMSGYNIACLTDLAGQLYQFKQDLSSVC